MTKPEELRRMADALGDLYGGALFKLREQAAAALREYAESLEREREPVAFRARVEEIWFHGKSEAWLRAALKAKLATDVDEVQPLFTHPPRSEPPKMTEAEIDKQWRGEAAP